MGRERIAVRTSLGLTENSIRPRKPTGRATTGRAGTDYGPDLLQLQRLVGNCATVAIVERQGQAEQLLRIPELRIQRDDDDVDVGTFFEDVAADDLKDQYNTMDPAMAKFAMRSGGLRDDFKDPTGVSEALSLPRNPDGSLTPAAIQIMLRVQQAEAQSYIDKSRTSTLTNAPNDAKGRKALKKRAAKHDPNTVTGKSRLPELANLLETKTRGPGQDMVTPMSMGGVQMNVFHNDSDKNLKPRLTMFDQAITKVAKQGFDFPVPLDVHLPKFGRTINAQTLCESASTPRAVFNPPNFIHLSPAVVGNPIDTTLGDDFKNLSTTLDPNGVGSVVHEIGHYMHYHKNPGRFFGLQGASFTREGDRISAKVSGYANGHPREFVAEVFLGFAYGRTWDDEIMEMYDAYDGAMTDRLHNKVRKARLKDSPKDAL